MRCGSPQTGGWYPCTPAYILQDADHACRTFVAGAMDIHFTQTFHNFCTRSRTGHGYRYRMRHIGQERPEQHDFRSFEMLAHLQKAFTERLPFKLRLRPQVKNHIMVQIWDGISVKLIAGPNNCSLNPIIKFD